MTFALMTLIMISFFVLIVKHRHSQVKLLSTILEEIKLLSEKNERMIDLLHSGVCNPAVRNIYSEIKELPFDKLPKTPKEFAILVRKITDENFKKAVAFFSQRIEQSDDIAEKEFFNNKLHKLQEIKLLSDTFDENSSQEYIEMIMQELAKTVAEFNGYEEN
jgi:hypothetical protein